MKKFEDLTMEEKKDLACEYAIEDSYDYDTDTLIEIAQDTLAKDLMNDESHLKEMYENANESDTE